MFIFAHIWEGPAGYWGLFPNSPSAQGLGAFIDTALQSDIITSGGATDTGVGGVVQTAVTGGNFIGGFFTGIGKLLAIDFGFFKIHPATRLLRFGIFIVIVIPTSITLIQYAYSLLFGRWR